MGVLKCTMGILMEEPCRGDGGETDQENSLTLFLFLPPVGQKEDELSLIGRTIYEA